MSEHIAMIYDKVEESVFRASTRVGILLKIRAMQKLTRWYTCRQAMKEIKTDDYRNIIIDCSYDILAIVLKQAQQVGIMSENHKIIITSLVSYQIINSINLYLIELRYHYL